MNARAATAADLDRLVDTLTRAFSDDPLWSWGFPNAADLAVWWRLLVASALRYPHVWVAGECAAVAVWIPPGGTELTAAEEESLPALLEKLIGARAGEVMELLERFDASHPSGEPHHYLSLLGTHPDHRGQGLGMKLLADCLGLIDAEGMPAYLESSNPANNARYERLGFTQVGEFSTPDDAHTVATMWREARQ